MWMSVVLKSDRYPFLGFICGWRGKGAEKEDGEHSPGVQEILMLAPDRNVLTRAG